MNRPALHVPRVEPAAIADVHEHQPVHQGHQLVEIIKVNLHGVVLGLPTSMCGGIPQLIPSVDFLLGDGTYVLEEPKRVYGVGADVEVSHF